VKKSPKDLALEKSLEAIKKGMGPGLAVQMGEAEFEDRDSFSTGSISLDIALRIGGIPRGMITEVYGKEGGGKSTMCMITCANAQSMGEHAAYIDVENGFDPTYAKAMGVDTKKLVLSQPDYGEQALSIVETLIDGGGLGIVVVDSVAMLTPRAEIEGEIGDAHVGLLSRMMAQALRKLTIKVRKANVALVFINQVRDVIGAVGAQEKTSTPGGRALKHQASLRMEMRRIAQIKDGDRVIGARTQAYIKKSRICSPYQGPEFDIIYGKGVWKGTDLLDVGFELGVFQKEGNTFSYLQEKLGVGRTAAARVLDDPATYTKFREVVMKKVKSQEN
jgi:recombination protein RecA